MYQKGTVMKFGYARVSTKEQSLYGQIEELEKNGCDQILSEKIGATLAHRPELEKLLDRLRSGDVVVITRLDRLGRSIKHLISLVERFNSAGVELVSLYEKIDTTTSTGRLMFHLLAMLAEFERNLISDRTKAGLEAARARGRKGGRPRLLTEKKLKLVNAALNDPKVTIKEVSEQFGVSRSTLYRSLKEIKK
jgi:DNA invertase Pin-like site-specific DNA recombinase